MRHSSFSCARVYLVQDQCRPVCLFTVVPIAISLSVPLKGVFCNSSDQPISTSLREEAWLPKIGAGTQSVLLGRSRSWIKLIEKSPGSASLLQARRRSIHSSLVSPSRRLLPFASNSYARLKLISDQP